MNKTRLVNRLRAVAKDMEPLTQAAKAGGMTWNGNEYIRATTDKDPDPYALAWWSTLNTLSDIIEYQDTELSPRQISYLERILFGGMGSLNDLWFDERQFGQTAREINNKLRYSREALFSAFKT
jgi:hypothetical protein